MLRQFGKFNRPYIIIAIFVCAVIVIICKSVFSGQDDYLLNVSRQNLSYKKSEEWWCPPPSPGELTNPTYRQVTLENPSSYKGWKHPYWPPEKSLNPEDYINVNDMTHFDASDCKRNMKKSDTSVFIMLHSNPNPGGELVRDDNRNTWMRFLKVTLKY